MTNKIRFHMETHEPGKISIPRLIATGCMLRAGVWEPGSYVQHWRYLRDIHIVEEQTLRPLRFELLEQIG